MSIPTSREARNLPFGPFTEIVNLPVVYAPPIQDPATGLIGWMMGYDPLP